MLQTLKHLCGLLHDSVVCPGFSCSEEPRTPSMDEQRGRITSLDLLAVLCLMHSRIPLAFFAARAHCCLMFNSVSTRTPISFSAKLLSASWPPPCTVVAIIYYYCSAGTPKFLLYLFSLMYSLRERDASLT